MADPRVLVVASDLDRMYIPVADATALETQGDLVSYESNAGIPMDAVGEDTTFVGYAITVHHADEDLPDEVTVGLKGHVEYDVTSATYGVGDGLKYTSDNALVADGGYSTIAWAAKREASAVTRLRCYIDVIALGKLFAVSA